jgi:TetR/AcrR family transcriptional regulator
MVSQVSRAAASRDRLLTAAAAEFAARGFAGAKVDRIAAKARVNKAMIYYHFKSKAALYHEILAGVFQTIADAIESDVTADTPEQRIHQFVGTIAREVSGRPHFASMWLREMADGGAHIDAAILGQMRRVLQVLAGIITRGEQAGQFQPAHPLVVQLGIVGPLLMFAASAPARDRLARHGAAFVSPRPEELLRHIERATAGALRLGPPAAAGARPLPTRRSRR